MDFKDIWEAEDKLLDGLASAKDEKLCMDCKHLFPNGIICKAFPNGIPEEIELNEVVHDKPIEGDHGIQFESKIPQVISKTPKTSKKQSAPKLKEFVKRINEGCLLGGYFISDRNRVIIPVAPEHLCSNAIHKNGILSFIWAGDHRAHSLKTVSVYRDVDEWHYVGLNGLQKMYLHLSPLWLPEHDEDFRRWEIEFANIKAYSESLQEVLIGYYSEKISPLPPLKKYKASYWIEHSEALGDYYEIGCLVASSKDVRFYGHAGFDHRAEEQNKAFAESEMAPMDIYEYYVDRGVGGYSSISQPIDIKAHSLEDAADLILSKSRYARMVPKPLDK